MFFQLFFYFSIKATVHTGPHPSEIYIPHTSPYQATSIDCWRIFEASWLSLKGQPQFSALQCLLSKTSYKIDSFALKKLFLNLNQEKFININNIIAFLTQEAKSIGVEVEWGTFMPSFGRPELSSLPGYFYQSHSVRFICESSQQPFSGEVQLLLSANPMSDIDSLNWLLLDRRSQAFDPVSYVDSLFTSISAWGQPCILSVHLARRGGISYQGLRWSGQNFIDPTSLIQLSSLE